MKTIFNPLQTLLPFALVTILASGCATPALWNHTAKHEWKPGPPDRALLISRTNDQKALMILFHQTVNDWSPMIGVKTNITRSAAWCVGQSPDRVIPSPEATSEFHGLLSISREVPIYDQYEVPKYASSKGSGYVVWNSTNTQLTVHIDGLPAGPFTVPATVQKQKTAERMAVAPFAVVGDAAITGTVAFCGGICLIYYSPVIAVASVGALVDISVKGMEKHPDTVTLHLFLENKPAASAGCQIYVDDKMFDARTNGLVALAKLPPGIHTIAITSSLESVATNILTKAGKDYFFEIGLQVTSGTVVPTLKELTKKEGIKRMNMPATKAKS